MQSSTFNTLILTCALLLQFVGGNSLPLRSAVNTPTADLEVIRKRVIEDLLAPPVNQDEIRRLIKTIRRDGSWPDINYKDVSRTGFEHGLHLENMFRLGRAYRKPDSPWFQNPEVKEAALSALDFWLENDFICDNWWWNEMGTPGRMINTLLVLDTDLNENQIRQGLRIAGRANLEASGARPGGDLIQIAGMLGKQALFRRDETVLQRVVEVMAEEIKLTTGRGLKPDMSFHHRVDNVICTLSYGLGYAESFAYWAVKTAGTRYSFPEGASRLLIDFFLDGICKSMVYGWYPDTGAKNRDLSRQGHLHPASAGLPEQLLKISPYRKQELENIAAIRKGERKPDLQWSRFFWHSEYYTHQRSDYFSSVRMHSSRNHTMEQPHNEEGLKMHHVGDGSNFISLTGKEYYDIFPVWDWQRVPGTTTLQKPVHPHWKTIARKGLTDFVGGTTDGRYGAVAMDFKSAHDPLSAKKAWFYFDDEYVCLGAAITAEAEYPVYTTLNQCKLNGEVISATRKVQRTANKGKHALAQAQWLWHDRVGYVFGQGENIHFSNTESRGSWRDINHQTSSPADTVVLDVFTAWIDHGVAPVNASYYYTVLPGRDPEEVDRYAKTSPVEVLQNTDAIQAVRHKSLGRTHIVFYRPGKIKADDNLVLTAESPCIVMIKTNGRTVEELAVSDPTQNLESVRVKMTALIEGSGEDWTAMWDKKDKLSVVDISLPRDGYAGQSVSVKFPIPQ